MSSLNIRTASIEDANTILHFITELAVYQKAGDQVQATIASIESSVFGPKSKVEALICELDGEAIGIAIYFYNYSTWLAKNGLYLEDLYITEQHRGIGAGKKMLQHLASIAIANDCGRFEWSCLDWNKPSRDFYESIGAVGQLNSIGYRMSGETLQNFAAASA